MTFTLSVIFYFVRILYMSKLRFHLIWDSLIAGAFFFHAGNIVLGLTGPFSYYSAPGDFLIILSTFGLLIHSKVSTQIITGIAVVIVAINLPSTLYYAQAYKNLSFQHNSAMSFFVEKSRINENHSLNRWR